MRAQPNRLEDKRYLGELSAALAVSKNNLHVDECGDWNIRSKEGNISTDTEKWYLYLRGDSIRNWTNLKKKLKFMHPHQDGDDEGILSLDRMPTSKEGAVVRKILKLRKSTTVAEVDRGVLKNRLRIPYSKGVSDDSMR